jgi:hypothetical protein
MRNTESSGTRKYDAASPSVSTSNVSPIPFGSALADADGLSGLGFVRGMVVPSTSPVVEKRTEYDNPILPRNRVTRTLMTIRIARSRPEDRQRRAPRLFDV